MIAVVITTIVIGGAACIAYVVYKVVDQIMEATCLPNKRRP